jgi:hypothetical protein
MLENKDYSNLSLDKLLAEQKKIKKSEIYVAAMIGFLLGVLIYGIVKKGFGIVHISIPVVLIIIIARGSKNYKQNLKQIQTEIKNKDIK